MGAIRFSRSSSPARLTSTEGSYRTKTIEGVEPDDRSSADGVRVLDFQQAVNRMMSRSRQKIRCSFCGKNRHQVEKLVAGPGVFICNACVAMCQLYMENPGEDEKLLIENGEPVMRDGQPVFVPFTEDEKRRKDELLEADG